MDLHILSPLKVRIAEFRENARFIFRGGEVAYSDVMLKEQIDNNRRHRLLTYAVAKKQMGTNFWDVQLRTKSGFFIRTKRKMLDHGVTDEKVVELFTMYTNTYYPDPDRPTDGIILKPTKKRYQLDEHIWITIWQNKFLSFRKNRNLFRYTLTAHAV